MNAKAYVNKCPFMKIEATRHGKGLVPHPKPNSPLEVITFDWPFNHRCTLPNLSRQELLRVLPVVCLKCHQVVCEETGLHCSPAGSAVEQLPSGLIKVQDDDGHKKPASGREFVDQPPLTHQLLQTSAGSI